MKMSPEEATSLRSAVAGRSRKGALQCSITEARVPSYIDILMESIEDAELDESGLSRVFDAINKHACGAISANRHNLSARENSELNHRLRGMLRNLGYSVTKVDGCFIEDMNGPSPNEVKEVSFFVANMIDGDDGGQLESDLATLGQTFDQDSVLSIPFGEEGHLLGTSTRPTAYPPYGQRESVGRFKGGKTAEFMSRIRGRPFTFQKDDPPSE